ncbi:Panacea domain-containing protein [Chloroflexota bacterium]
MKKIQSTGLYILSKYGKEAGTIELNKLFYLVDVASYRLFGKSISNTKYIRAEKGPYSRAISEQLFLLDGKQIKRTKKPSKGYSSFPKIAWTAIEETQTEPELDSVEKELINQVLQKIKGLAPKDLEKLSYQTEPMLDILEKESKSKCDTLQEPLDFSKIKRDEYMQEFLDNYQKPLSEEEKKQKEYYDREWKQVEVVLQALE